MTTTVLAVVAGVVGLAIGSFLNVVIYRVPRGESVLHPRSHCPFCCSGIRPRDEVPVLSWMLLRGRCRDCGARISPRYPLIEALTAAAFVSFALRLGVSAQLPAFLYLAAVGVALAVIDLDTRRLPDVLVLPSYPVGLAALGIAALATGAYGQLGRASVGMAALFVFYFLLAFIYPAGMGFGDVKLAGVVGLYLAWLGWGSLFVGAFTGFLLGAVAGVALLFTGRAGRKTAIPYGPFMLAGAFVAVLFGQQLSSAYTSLSLG